MGIGIIFGVVKKHAQSARSTEWEEEALADHLEDPMKRPSAGTAV
jgi:hypothetical protein